MILPGKRLYSIQALQTNIGKPFPSPINKFNDLSKIKDKQTVSFDQNEQIQQKYSQT